MKNLSRLLFVAVLLISFSTTHAQDKNNPWAFTIGSNAVDFYPVGEDTPQGDYFDESSIGRVVVRDNYRKLGYGHKITDAAIKAIEEYYKANKIKISAQTYLVTFYESHGFKTIGDRYSEDGIPHIAMIRA